MLRYIRTGNTRLMVRGKIIDKLFDMLTRQHILSDNSEWNISYFTIIVLDSLVNLLSFSSAFSLCYSSSLISSTSTFSEATIPIGCSRIHPVMCIVLPQFGHSQSVSLSKLYTASDHIPFSFSKLLTS